MKTIGKLMRQSIRLLKGLSCLACLAVSLTLIATATFAGEFVQQGSLITTLGGANNATNTFFLTNAGNTNLPVALGPAFSVSGITSQGLTLIVEILASNAAGTSNNGTINLMLAPAVNSLRFATANNILVGVAHNGVTATTWVTNIAQSAFGAADSIRLYNITTTNQGTFSISNVLARAILTTF